MSSIQTIHNRISKLEGRRGVNTGIVIIYQNHEDFRHQVSKLSDGRIVIGIPYNGRDPLQ